MQSPKFGQAGDLAGNGALGDGKPLCDVADTGRLIHEEINKNLSLLSIKHSRYIRKDDLSQASFNIAVIGCFENSVRLRETSDGKGKEDLTRSS